MRDIYGIQELDMDTEKKLTGTVHYLTILTLCLAIPISARAASHIPAEEPGSIQPVYGQNAPDIRGTDQELAKQVNKVLKPYPGITASTDNGLVLITGSIDDMEQCNAVINRASSLPGVRTVEYRLSIQHTK